MNNPFIIVIFIYLSLNIFFISIYFNLKRNILIIVLLNIGNQVVTNKGIQAVVTTGCLFESNLMT